LIKQPHYLYRMNEGVLRVETKYDWISSKDVASEV
jgi:hypothetical protein